VLLDLTVGDFLDISMTLGRVFEIGVSHTKGDLATDWSPSSSQLVASKLTGKLVWLNAQNSVELAKRLRQFHSAHVSSSTDTSACVLIRQSAPVDLHLLKNFVEVLTLPKGSLFVNCLMTESGLLLRVLRNCVSCILLLLLTKRLQRQV
jgi:hypothetical protein